MNGYIQNGASPRATIALTLAARAMAFLNGRHFVTPQDVKTVALDVLRHRVSVTYEAEAENITSENVIEKILERAARALTPWPRTAQKSNKAIMSGMRQLEIRTRRMVNDSLAGAYHSVFKGRGMDFDEVREYSPGDEVRTIDWNVTARAGRTFVKKFTEERELTILLLVDISASGNFGSGSHEQARSGRGARERAGFLRHPQQRQGRACCSIPTASNAICRRRRGGVTCCAWCGTFFITRRRAGAPTPSRRSTWSITCCIGAPSYS